MKSYISSNGEESGYTYVKQKRKIKSDWAGISLGDGFRNNLDYFTKMTGQKLFYTEVKKVQDQVIALMNSEGGSDRFKRIKAQLDPFYTSYPVNLAAQASIGLTAYLQFQQMSENNLMIKHLEEYLKDPAKTDRVSCDPHVYNHCINYAAQNVQTRIYLEDVSRTLNLPSIEVYRVYNASQQDLRFPSLNHILKAVILYGDLLPEAKNLKLHYLTQTIIRDLTNLSRARYDELAYYRMSKWGSGNFLINLGQRWLREIGKSLVKFLPDKPVPKQPEEIENELIQRMPERLQKLVKKRNKLSHPENNPEQENEKINPLNQPTPPSLSDSSNSAKNANKARESSQSDFKMGKAENNDVSQVSETLKALNEAVHKAAISQQDYEDIRSDLMEKSSSVKDFKSSRVEGVPSEGHEVVVNLKNDNQIAGEIFDRRIEHETDYSRASELEEKSESLIRTLNRTIYPNIKEVPIPLTLRTSGSLDPARLPLASFSNTVFRRYDIANSQDKEGKPVIAIACDGSGSLDGDQMNMLKILANSWVHSTRNSRIKPLSALYHSGDIREGVNRPLVQWMYHPEKTPELSPSEVTSAISSLPDTGTGVQSDVLSLSFIFEEAEKISKGSSIYLVLITDCCWNCSYRSDLSGFDEVRQFLEGKYEELGSRLHTTLVALGVNETSLEDLVDKVIPVSSQDLNHSNAVAEKISLYVAGCMKERRMMLKETV